ncbi:MAG: hypothetical protein RL518_165 [Pseudomonadota bacterium]|jgi:glutamate/tyrosine decarboxylase-like PLP-dependent enzyme
MSIQMLRRNFFIWELSPAATVGSSVVLDWASDALHALGIVVAGSSLAWYRS